MIIVTIAYIIILIACIAQHIQGFPCSWNITFPMLTAACIAIYGSAEDMCYEDLRRLCADESLSDEEIQMPQMHYYLTEPAFFYGWLLFNWIVYAVVPWVQVYWWPIYPAALMAILYSIYSRLLDQKILLENLYNK